MRTRNAGNSSLLAVLAVGVLILGFIAWIFIAPASVEGDGGGEDPAVTTGGGTPSAGSYEGGQEPAADNPGEVGAEREELTPTGAGVGAAAERPGGLRGKVVDGDGAGIGGAQVFLSKRIGGGLFGAPADQGAPEDQQRVVEQTGGDGGFYIAELPGGAEYELWVSHPDYGAQTGPPIVIQAGDVQELPPIVMDGGYALTGMVTDTAGNPLPATVELYLQSMDFLRSGDAAELRKQDMDAGRLKIVETDGNGEFRVEHLAEGIWSAQAYCDGFASNIVRAITLMDGREAAPVVIELDTEHLISGRVETVDGEPIEGAQVQVARVKPRPVITGGAVSGADGTFIVGQLPEGSYGVLIMKEGFTNQRVGRTEAGGDPLRVVMVAKGEINGRVVAPDGSPVTKFSLELLTPMRGQDHFRKLGKVYQFEDENGDFTITDAEPYQYILLARADGFAPTYSAPFTAERDNSGEIVDVVMKTGATIVGRVVDADSGEGVPGVELSLHMAGYEPIEGDTMFAGVFQDLGNIPATKVRSGADGSFRIDDAYVDRMALLADKAGFLPLTTEITTSPGAELKVGEIRIRAGGTITGTAVDADGKPLAGGSVNLVRPGDTYQRRVTLDARGRFTIDSLRSGQYELSPLPPADPNMFLFPSEGGAERVYVEEGKTINVELKLPRQPQ